MPPVCSHGRCWEGEYHSSMSDASMYYQKILTSLDQLSAGLLANSCCLPHSTADNLATRSLNYNSKSNPSPPLSRACMQSHQHF